MEDMRINLYGDIVFMDDIKFQVDLQQMSKRLRIEPGSGDFGSLAGMAEGAMVAGKPKALYRIAYIQERTEDTVVIEGVTLKSRILRVNLENAHRVFLYLVTCGAELDDWAKQYDGDPLLAYFADHIKETALGGAANLLFDYLKREYRLGKYSKMAPGSLKDWPIEQQKPFFEIMGDVGRIIDFKLTKSFLMLPRKSVSGILFPKEIDFESCMLCPRENCTGRRAPYNKEMIAEYR